MIPFNKPFLTGKEPIICIRRFTQANCSVTVVPQESAKEFFEEKYRFKKGLLTTSLIHSFYNYLWDFITAKRNPLIIIVELVGICYL